MDTLADFLAKYTTKRLERCILAEHRYLSNGELDCNHWVWYEALIEEYLKRS